MKNIAVVGGDMRNRILVEMVEIMFFRLLLGMRRMEIF